jgi:hypothetical protein
MSVIAHLISRSEALVVASMLDAAGIIAHIGGENHASVEINSIALGGYRITVPEWQHFSASNILENTFANMDRPFSEGLQTAIIRFLLIWFGSFCIWITPFAFLNGINPLSVYPYGLLGVIGVPVSPQGIGDYYLSEADIDSD